MREDEEREERKGGGGEEREEKRSVQRIEEKKRRYDLLYIYSPRIRLLSSSSPLLSSPLFSLFSSLLFSLPFFKSSATMW